MLGWVILLLLILITITLASSKPEHFMSGTSRNAVLRSDITTLYEKGKKYMDYQALSKIPLSPWQFERLMNLAKKRTLTDENIDIIMGL